MSPKEILAKLKTDLVSIANVEELDNFKNSFFSPESEISKLLKEITKLKVEERKEFGQIVNETKMSAEEYFRSKRTELLEKKYSEITNDKIDISFSNQSKPKTWINPVTTARWELEDIFMKMGFNVEYPYEVDTYENVFEYVNIPKGHPAADSWDTFYLADGQIPITHTSSMQNRILKKLSTVLDNQKSSDMHAYIVPGRCFRNEATDGRHEHTFTQLEGVVVGKGIKFSDLLGTMKTAFGEYFQKEIQIRVIPDFFPFVEPGNGVEIKWENPDERILKITHGTGWLEVLGCGMIHPNVLKMAGIDPEVYTGFAWGTGIERLFMIKSGVEDLRLFHSGNVDFLEQFAK